MQISLNEPITFHFAFWLSIYADSDRKTFNMPNYTKLFYLVKSWNATSYEMSSVMLKCVAGLMFDSTNSE